MSEENQRLDPRELENTPLFRGVEIASILGLLETCPIQRLNAKEELLHSGKPNRTIYILLSGQLEVFLKPNQAPIAVLEPGEAVGEISVFDGKVTTGSVVAKKPSRVLAISTEIVGSLLDASSLIAQNLLAMMAGRLRKKDELLERGQEQLEFVRYSVLDPLSGFYNQGWLDTTLPTHLKRCKQGGLPLLLLIVGLDYFETYSTHHGPLAADRAIYTVAWILRQNLRPGELIAHHRKGEFTILLPNVELSVAESMADRLCEAISKAKMVDLNQRHLPSISASVGIAQMEDRETAKSLISVAHGALQEAQRRGGRQAFRREPTEA